MKRAFGDISTAFETGMQKGESAPPEDQKLFGLIELPPGVLTGVLTAWSTGLTHYSTQISDFVFKHSNSMGTKLLPNVAEGHIKIGAGALAASVTIAAVAAPDLSPFFETQSKQKKKTVEAAKRVAPVLEEIKGKQGVGAFASIKQSDNEVLYAHRKRINDKAGIEYTNHFISLVKAFPALIKTVAHQQHGTAAAEALDGAAAQPGKPGLNLDAADIVSAGLTPIIRGFQGQNEKKFDSKNQPYTGLDMILELERQVSADPELSNYALPKGGNSRAMSLTDYVAEIIRHHQRDMEALDPEYTPIRKALDNQLKEIAEPIAEAIKKGDISTLALVRLVGEGHIIKNKGRSLAKPSEVKVLLEKMSVNAAAYTHLDPKEYYADAAFNKKELKESLGALQGDEKIHFAAMFPDTVLHEAGMSEAEVKDLRAATVKTYETNLGNIIIGLGAEEDKALHDMGLAKEEIKEIRDAAEQIKAKGEEAVHEVRAKPNNPIGIERLVANAAVGQILSGERNYLGTLVNKSVVAKAEAPIAKEEQADVVAKDVMPEEADQDAEIATHAAKESRRREQVSEQQEVAV